MMEMEQWHKVAGIDGLNLLHREGERETSSLVLERERPRDRERKKKKNGDAWLVCKNWFFT